MRILSVSIIFLFALISWGCDDSGILGGKVCTLIGCEDGVSILIGEERPDSLSIIVFVDDESEPFGSVDCTHPDHPCSFRINGVTPEIVSVQIEWDGGEYLESFEPDYEAYQLNGTGCPPTCVDASIVINTFVGF